MVVREKDGREEAGRRVVLHLQLWIDDLFLWVQSCSVVTGFTGCWFSFGQFVIVTQCRSHKRSCPVK